MRIITFLIFFFSFHLVAGEIEEEYYVDSIRWSCLPVIGCQKYLNNNVAFRPGLYSNQSLKKLISRFAKHESVKTLDYKLQKVENKTHLYVDILLKREIRNIKIKKNKKIDVFNLLSLISYREGSFFELNDYDTRKKIKNFLKNKGLSKSKIKIKYLEYKNFIDIIIVLDLQSDRYVKEVRVLYDDKKKNHIYYRLQKSMQGFVGRPWDRLEFKLRVGEFSKDLFREGFFQSKIKELKALKRKKGLVLGLGLFLGPKYLFGFRGNTLFLRNELVLKIKDKALKSLNKLDEAYLKKILQNIYEENGVFNSHIDVRKNISYSKDHIKLITFFVDIREGEKIKIDKLLFYGNHFFKDQKLERLFFEKGSALTQNYFLDKADAEKYLDIIQKIYIENGFLFLEINGPKYTYSKDKKTAQIRYEIKEKQQSLLTKINLKNIPGSLNEQIIHRMVNKSQMPLNINFLEEDLQTILDEVRNNGHYFARFQSLESTNILKYSERYDKAILDINLTLEKKSVFHSVTIFGNTKTNEKVIRREFNMKKGEIITPKKIAFLKNRLLGLGLFSNVTITSTVINKYDESDVYLIHLVLQVREKDAGTIEIAPGYRTDLGLKLSSSISYNNLFGKKNAVSFKIRLNHRLSDFRNLDERRRSKEKKYIEFFTKLDYIEPYLFNYDLESKLSLSYKRKKFFSFDADIIRFSPIVSKAFSKHFSTSLSYQLEKIRQYDGTDLEKDNGVFKVGGLTGSVAFDWRNNRILPQRGAYLGISSEFANPTFLSTKRENANREVNYAKFIMRSKYYIPLIFDYWTLATSLSMGYQKNLGPDFIPTIKVFRLGGVDSVRGFADDEINRLATDEKRDISEVEIKKSAYFLNFKLGPRYDVNDQVMVGVFFDAGRIFVNHFRPLKLKTSMGLSFKFKTPVGTLDFDYGVKLKRESSAPGRRREGFGRFHLSIGLF